MPKEYYFWKWADNELSGNPAEVHSALLRGKMHPALQTFNARPLLRRLEKARDKGQDWQEEWDWSLYPKDSPGKAHFLFVTCPMDGGYSGKFKEVFLPLALVCYDERRGQLAEDFLPKLNYLIWGQHPGRVLYDVCESDLKEALSQIDAKRKDPYAILTDRRFNFVQCLAAGRRFMVEWRENYDLHHPTKFDHWRAQDAKRLAAVGGNYDGKFSKNKHPALLRFADALQIFKAFLKGEQMPVSYPWRNINHLL